MKQEEPVDLKTLGGFMRQPAIKTVARKILNKGDAVFTIGSCFALEVRRALIAQGFRTFPDYASVRFDRASQVFDKIPQREMPAHYDTFTMRQEFEAALGVWKDRERGYWDVQNSPINDMLHAPKVMQDPYRKLTYAITQPELIGLSDRITAAFREGLEASRVVVITLGLTEVWRHKETGKYICRPPGTGYGGGVGRAVFHLGTFMENYENMKAILDLLFGAYPNRHVILSVSPVRLGRTFSNVDVGTANFESKSILRAVAGQIARDYPQQVTYYPSYEMAMVGLGAFTGTGAVFEDDGAHVRPDFVNMVTSSFMRLMT